MKLLLDTCALSELNRQEGNPGVRGLVATTADADLYISVISLGEITKGIALLPEGNRKKQLATWCSGLFHHFSDRLLPVDQDTADIWGKLTARAQSQGQIIPVAAGLIAATALRHGLAVVTRNSRDFAATGAFIVDPWAVP